MKKIALDLEFNTVGKIQEIISVGAVVLDENLNIITEYESYIKLSLTKKLDPFAQKVHKIKKEDLENARDFKTVFRELIHILDLQNGDTIMTWGGGDKASLISNSRSHNCEEEFKILTTKVKDISHKTQQKVLYKGKTIKNQLALETLRLLCNIEQEVSHNALDDARCLAEIYKYTHNKKVVSNDEILGAIFEKQKAKQIAKKKKLESHYKIIDTFEKEHSDGIMISRLSEKAIKQIRAIINQPKTSSNFRNLSRENGEILTNGNNYIAKNGILSKGVICKIHINKNTDTNEREMFVIFIKNSELYHSHFTINNSTVERAKHLITALN